MTTHRTNQQRVAAAKAADAMAQMKAVLHKLQRSDSRWPNLGFKLINGARITIFEGYGEGDGHEITRLENDTAIYIPNIYRDNDDDDGWSPTPTDSRLTDRSEDYLLPEVEDEP